MARVRTSEDCTHRNIYHEQDTEFDYFGPEQSHLTLVSGQWDEPRPPEKESESDALKRENEALKARLEALGADNTGARAKANKKLPQLPAATA